MDTDRLTGFRIDSQALRRKKGKRKKEKLVKGRGRKEKEEVEDIKEGKRERRRKKEMRERWKRSGENQSAVTVREEMKGREKL